MPDAATMPDLTAAFPAATREAWLGLVSKALKGADFDRRLKSRTADGIAIEPIYRGRPDAVAISGAGAAAPWLVTARVDHPVAAEASAQALADLEGGANGLALAFAGSPAARGWGIRADSVDDLDAALANVMLDLIALRLEPSPDGTIAAALVAALVARRGFAPARMQISFGLDPIGTLATRGSLPTDWAATGKRLAATIATLRGRGFTGPFVTCDSRPFHEAGASEAQEIAAAVAAGVAYARVLEGAGMPVADAFALLSWTMAIDADQFLGIAKLRALRRLWRQVAAASGVGDRPMTIHAETAWRGLTRRDAAVNMLRATTATFSAAAGGADGITVLPHTSALGLPDGLARRIARNTQLVLQEESNLWRVADPAAGSGAVEALTDELAEAAWGEFQQIEREGGLPASLADGAIQGRIARVATARAKDVATRKAAITGTSEFPSLAEAQGGTLDVARIAAPVVADAAMSFDSILGALEAGGSRADMRSGHTTGMTAPPLGCHRLAAPFEALRDAADAIAAKGTRPLVFLANLGSLAEFGGRATWITNLLAAGGIAVVPTDGFTASGDVGAAFAASGADVACICGADDTYAILAEATAQALKSAGARRVLLAGKPGEAEAALTSAGIDQFLFAGQDVVAALGQLHTVWTGTTR